MAFPERIRYWLISAIFEYIYRQIFLLDLKIYRFVISGKTHDANEFHSLHTLATDCRVSVAGLTAWDIKKEEKMLRGVESIKIFEKE